MVARHSIDYSPPTSTAYSRIYLLSLSLFLLLARFLPPAALVVSRATTAGVAPRSEHTPGYTGLCTRSDGYICSLFRRVFVFTGTLFTTG